MTCSCVCSVAEQSVQSEEMFYMWGGGGLAGNWYIGDMGMMGGRVEADCWEWVEMAITEMRSSKAEHLKRKLQGGKWGWCFFLALSEMGYMYSL